MLGFAFINQVYLLKVMVQQKYCQKLFFSFISLNKADKIENFRYIVIFATIYLRLKINYLFMMYN